MGLLSGRKRRKQQHRREPKLFAGRGRSSEKPRRRRSFARIVLGFSFAIVFWAALASIIAFGYVWMSLDQKGLLQIPDREPGIMLLASNGTVLSEQGAFFGDEIQVKDLPDYVPNAVLAIEDRRFRQHYGIDPIGLTRAIYENFKAGRVVQGGSTVTQQLAKNLFLKPDRTMERKVQEMVLAIWLETRFTKDEILQLYLNRVYYGSGATGIEKAAQTYYNKSARELDINEAATLAGLLKAPSNYNPIAHPKVAAARAALVIDSMVESDFITQSEADAAINSPAAVAASDYIPATQYVVDWVNEQLPDLASKYDQSIIVETTIDPDLQALAEKSLRKRLNEEGKKLNIGQGALVLMDAGGAVKAMVGGRSYKRSQFNRATKAKRQPGSAFKPFVYLAAIENGYTPSSVEVDEPIRIGDWEPDNYKHKYAGPVTLKRALAQSLNTIAAKLTNEVGPQAVVRVAHKLGIGSPLGTDASIALGTSEVTLLEMTGAFAPFANGGQTVAPYAITRISTRDGKVLYERSGDGLGRAISIYDVGFMNEMMRAVVQEGTAKRAAFDGQDLGGKTGTSQDSRDAWFVGYSSYLVAGVWVGNDDNSPMRNVTGGTLPAKIWKDVMEVAHAGLPFQALPGITDDEPATDEPVNVSEYGDESLYEEEPDQRPRRGKGFFESLFNSEDEPSRKKPRKGDKTAFQEMQERLKNK